MQAHVGDWIELSEGRGHPHSRRGLIVGVNHGDGTPPYRVRWLDDERESVLFPPPDAHIRHSLIARVSGGVGRAT
jgi:Domain of unknown function (DUF1918)